MRNSFTRHTEGHASGERRSALVCCIVVALAAGGEAATVKKRDGSVVEGTISGLIVQKGQVEEGAGDGGKKTFTASYKLINGGDIAAIDEDGVHRKGNTFAFATVTEKAAPLDDFVALETVANLARGQWMAYTATGGQVVALGGTTAGSGGADPTPVLGEYRKAGPGGKAQLLRSLEITTPQGTVSVSIADVVPFRPKAK